MLSSAARGGAIAATTSKAHDLVLQSRLWSSRAAVATLDSSLRLGVIGEHELGELFRRLPRRYRILRRLIDARAESGPESLVRLMLRRLGCRFDLQVRIAGVGRVDLLVADWLIIECDSEARHGTWEDRKRDLRRDQEAAKLGYVTYYPIAEDVMWHPDDVFAALKGLLARNPRSELRTDRAHRGCGIARDAIAPEF